MGFRPENQNQPPTAQTANPDEDPSGWLGRARAAFRTSTSYVDTNLRKQWDDSIRAFHSQHPTDSKYASPAYAKRSNIFRPKTRSVIRKNEAASAAAFFSNMDVVSIGAEDQSSKAQLMSAEIMKALLQYRLKKSIPWFLFTQGGIQDAQVTGAACAHIYWDYRTRKKMEQPAEEVVEETESTDDENPTQRNLPKGAFVMGAQDGQDQEPATPAGPTMEVYVDKPVVDLIPIENMRVDPSANWMDPINSSPYVIHLIPMYVMDVIAKAEAGEWKPVSTSQLSAAVSAGSDTTRAARNKDRDDPQSSENRAYTDVDIVWVQRHIHRKSDRDYEFYTLGEVALLTDARPLTEVVFHGKRPYVMGTFIVETHKVLSSGLPMLGKGLQDETNEIANQRIDNVKFVLNKKWFAKRGKDVDVQALVRNVPGGVVMMDDPTNDVREISYQDVTGSSFEEQNRINLDMDELMGNFNPAALIANGGGQAPARNMALLNQSNGTLVEYGIRTYTETFLEPVLRQLILLEQEYETDEVVLALASRNAKLMQKFGQDAVTDDLLRHELTLIVNVGMGATDPTQKLQKFLTAVNTFSAILKNATPGLNPMEVGKEIFAHLGYTDATRFFTTDNPEVAALKDQLQKAMAELQQMGVKLKEKQSQQIVGLTKTRETNATKIEATRIQEEAANKRSLATHIRSIMAEAYAPTRTTPART